MCDALLAANHLRHREAARPSRDEPSIALVKSPDPLVISWRGGQLHVRHDDRRLTPHSPRGATIRSAIEFATGVEGLRLVLMTTVGDHYA
jgi:hypothetical protein